MLYDVVDFPAKYQIFQILTVHQILVCFTCDFLFAVFIFIFSVCCFHMPQLLPITSVESDTHISPA